MEDKHPFDRAIPSALTAGLGAVALRNKLRNIDNINELSLSDVGDTVSDAWNTGKNVLSKGLKFVSQMKDEATTGRLHKQIAEKQGELADIHSKYVKSPGPFVSDSSYSGSALGRVGRNTQTLGQHIDNVGHSAGKAWDNLSAASKAGIVGAGAAGTGAYMLGKRRSNPYG